MEVLKSRDWICSEYWPKKVTAVEDGVDDKDE
ncbi:hypothetical protein EGR_10992 [Echinococcus granulosus]|uniref:Uncharacterized protein n=1 Tax=Echinococcus granulosus TaxID=6210 RepID=W6U702_ECHGR|nr:hypothetical protein EGR_10992 [Echinococcus granulosus]EUB54147.1 hypothetical protein EGR_10992 [Echinococcus granulosus]